MDDTGFEHHERFAEYVASHTTSRRYVSAAPSTAPHIPATGIPAPGIPISESECLADPSSADEDAVAKPGCVTFEEGQDDVTFEKLFGRYLEGVRRIEITDPGIQDPVECKTLLEFLECATRHFDHSVPRAMCQLTTAPSESDIDWQIDYLEDIVIVMAPYGLSFSYKLVNEAAQAEAHIRLDDTWDITLSRGLNIYHPYNGFITAMENRLPSMRKVHAFQIEYRKLD